MSNNSSIREQLTYKAGLQMIFVVGAVIFSVLYTLPKISEVNSTVNDTNTKIDVFNKIEQNGMTFDDLTKTISENANYSEISDIIKKAKDDVKNILEKEDKNKTYLAWLTSTLTNNDKDKKILEIRKAKVNTIIPTLSPVNENVTEETVTLRDYIVYIEQNILRKFGIVSYSPLGINGVSYKQSEDEKESSEIGSFQLELSFKDTPISNISKLLDFIQDAGKPTILDEGDDAQVWRVMSNPLITVEDLSITETIEKKFPNKAVSGRIVLNFYVRGSSQSSQTYLMETFNKQKNELEKLINERIASCKQATTTCLEVEKLEQVQRKFRDFNRSFSSALNSKKGRGVEEMYLITQQLQSLKSIRQEFENIK